MKSFNASSSLTEAALIFPPSWILKMARFTHLALVYSFKSTRTDFKLLNEGIRMSHRLTLPGVAHKTSASIRILVSSGTLASAFSSQGPAAALAMVDIRCRRASHSSSLVWIAYDRKLSRHDAFRIIKSSRSSPLLL